MASLNPIQIMIPRENVDQNQRNIRVPSEVEAFDFTPRVQWLQAAVLGANDGFVSVASLMMGAGAVEDEVRAVVITFLAGLFASACSMAIGELVSASSQLDVVIAQMKREGLTNPLRAALESALAFALGAFAPILVVAYVTDYSFRLAVATVAATTVVLVTCGSLGAALGRPRVVSSCVRVLMGGWMAMAIAVGLTKLLSANALEL